MKLEINGVASLEDAVEKGNVDLNTWDIKDYKVNFWTGPSKDGMVQHSQVTLYLRPKAILSREELLEIFSEAGRTTIKHKTPKMGKDFAYEIAMFDVHLGKIAMQNTTNNTYNLKTAENDYKNSFSELIEYGKNFSPERVLLPIGNDFLHSDTHTRTTTAGTQMIGADCVYRSFKLGAELLVWSVYKALELAENVDLVVIQGNHDTMSSVFLSEYVAAWFRQHHGVNVDTRPLPRKYYRYGTTLLGLTHGKDEKVQSLGSIMAREVPDLWAETRYREFHIGHHHKKSVFADESDVRIRRIPSICGTDDFHFTHGYVNSLRSAESFLWSLTKGLVGNFSSYPEHADNPVPTPTVDEVEELIMGQIGEFTRKSIVEQTKQAPSTISDKIDKLLGQGRVIREARGVYRVLDNLFMV